MEKIFEQGLLYDFYGELLTSHQRKIYEDAVYNDMSLSEIGEEMGISRQGVHDIIKRCDKILSDYEDKLHLVNKFSETKQTLNKMLKITEEALMTEEKSSVNTDKLREIQKLGNSLLKEL